MVRVTEKDRVRVATREQTSEDARNATYFPFLGGLTGTVLKVYSAQEVAVEVEPASLSADIRRRHHDIRDQMKTKWLDGLSEEGRSRLTEREKDFHLRYIVLVSMGDLEKIAPVQPPPPSAEATDPEAPARLTSADLERAEAEELLRRAGRPPD